MNKQVLVLSVFRKKALLDDNERQWLYPTPILALRTVTESLRSKIEQYRNLLVEQQLVSVACSDSEISWFKSVEQTSRIPAKAVMHISLNKIWFSGRVEPHSEDYFETQSIQIADIFDDAGSIKTIECHQFNSPLAMPLIREILKQSAKYEVLLERYYAFEELSDSLNETKNIETDCLNTNLDSMCHELAQQLDILNLNAEKAEANIDSLCLKLLNVVFGVRAGDRIDYLSPDADNPINLVINKASFYDGSLILSGLKVRKKGGVGKREESIYIPLQVAE